MADTLFVPVLLALQFAAFGWRINREIAVGDEGRRTWLPLTDYVNLLSMITLALVTIVMPLAKHHSVTAIRIVIASAATLVAFHPINTAAHYRLFGKSGRLIYTNGDIPLISDQEWVTLVITAILLTAVVCWVR